MKLMRSFSVVIVCFIGLVSTDLGCANDLLSAPPIYDVEAGCRRQLGQRDDLFNQCVASEQSYYDDIKYVWPRLSDRGRSRVFSVFYEIKNRQQIPVRAYSVLSSVVIDEIERDRADMLSNTPQKFVP